MQPSPIEALNDHLRARVCTYRKYARSQTRTNGNLEEEGSNHELQLELDDDPGADTAEQANEQADDDLEDTTEETKDEAQDKVDEGGEADIKDKEEVEVERQVNVKGKDGTTATDDELDDDGQESEEVTGAVGETMAVRYGNIDERNDVRENRNDNVDGNGGGSESDEEVDLDFEVDIELGKDADHGPGGAGLERTRLE